MENYIFFHRNGECRITKADPARPETWPYQQEEIRDVHQDCTELFLKRAVIPRLTRDPLTVRFAAPAMTEGNKESENLQKLLEYIADHYKEKLSVDFALEKMNMGKSRFHAFFRSQTGMSFVTYINKERIKKALPLLLETNQTIETIGFDCGFDSPSHFYKCFKEHYGMSPARYRAEKINYSSFKGDY